MLDARMVRAQAAIHREERRREGREPANQYRIKVAVRLPPLAHSKFAEIANALGTTRGELARNLILQFMREYNAKTIGGGQ